MKKCQGIHKKEEKEDYGDWFGGLERTDRNYRNYQIFLISIVQTHGKNYHNYFAVEKFAISLNCPTIINKSWEI